MISIFMGRLYEDSVIDYLNTLLTHCRATCCKRLTTDIIKVYTIGYVVRE